MKKSSFALLLSIPALLATFLMSGNAVSANTLNDLVSNNSVNSLASKDANAYLTSIVIERSPNSDASSQKSFDDRTNILMSDRIGDLAISKLGCDCMGCRQTALTFLSK
jgi:hypothetical protein